VSNQKRPYNGLRVPAFGGQVHDIGGGKDRDTVIQQAFAAQMQALMREMYVRVASAMMLAEHPEGPMRADFEELARTCQTAAMAYFEGLGMIRKPEQTDEPADDSNIQEHSPL